jgi:hypothetical protein
MNKSNFIFKPVVYLVLLIYIPFTYTVLAMENKIIAALVPEDHFFEIIGASSLFVTSLLFLYGFRVARRSLDKTWISLIKELVYLGLALLFFFGAGEEISWGQRIFGFKTPQPLAQVNKQDELNLHNLSVLENSKFFTADRLFDAFWFLFAVFTPAVALLLPAFRRFVGKFIPIVYWGIGLLFLYNFLWAKAAKLLYRASYAFDNLSLTQATQEIKESNYAIVFILVGLFAIWDLNNSKDINIIPLKSATVPIEPTFHD